MVSMTSLVKADEVCRVKYSCVIESKDMAERSGFVGTCTVMNWYGRLGGLGRFVAFYGSVRYGE